MFLSDPNYWLAAITMQRFCWLEGEKAHSDRDILIKMLGSKWRNEIWKMAVIYKVARNFPLFIRSRAETHIAKAKIQDFDSFVFQTRKITQTIYDLEKMKPNSRAFFAISGVSKILWHRFPEHGFIYDDQTRIALFNNGLVAPFFETVVDWGGSAANDRKREAEFLIFAAAYKTYCLPLCEPLTKLLKSDIHLEKLDNEPMIRANRILDKLLWIAGEEENKQQQHVKKWAENAGQEDQESAEQIAKISSDHLQHWL